MLGAWLALLLARRWHPEPSWIDRMGRALGLYWVSPALRLLRPPVGAGGPGLPFRGLLMTSRILVAAIFLTTVAGGIVAVRWADRDFPARRAAIASARRGGRVCMGQVAPSALSPIAARQHWACVAASLGMGAVLAAGGRAPRSGPGVSAAIVSALVVAATVGHSLLAAPAIFWMNGTSYGLGNALEFTVPGAILGAWTVGWLLAKAGTSRLAGVGRPHRGMPVDVEGRAADRLRNPVRLTHGAGLALRGGPDFGSLLGLDLRRVGSARSTREPPAPFQPNPADRRNADRPTRGRPFRFKVGAIPTDRHGDPSSPGGGRMDDRKIRG